VTIREIDGGQGEGGGQMLRTALSLSCILKEEIHIKNIRANRPKPGLAPQHLTTVELLRDMTRAEVEGAELRSTELTFKPQKPHGDYFYVDIGTAGSVSLLFQAAIYPALFSDFRCELEIRGGTDVKWSPSADYIKEVFLPATGMVEFVHLDLRRRGYYPKGGGDILASVRPGRPGPVVLESGGKLKGIRGRIHSCGLPEHIADRMESAAKEVLGKNLVVETMTGHSRSPGCGITLWTETDKGAFLGASALGERGVKAEVVGRNAAEALNLEIESGASVDVHQADQLLIPLALYGGEFHCRELSQHTKTNIEVIHMFFGDVIEVEEKEDLYRVHSEGKGK
jgi:RNA 3'-phosphate cyclase